MFSSMQYTLHSSLPAFQGCRVLQYAVHIAFILASLSGMPCSPVCGTHCIHPCRPFRDAVFSSMRYTLHSSLPAFQGCRVLQYAVHITFILASLSGMPCSPVCGTHCIHPCRPFRDAVFSSMRYTLHSSLPAFQGCRVLQYAVHIAFILAGLSGMPCSPVCGTHCIHPCRPFRDAVFSSMRYTLHSSLPAFQGCRVLQYAVHIAFILAGLSGMPCSPVCGTHCIHPCRPFRDAVFSSMRYTLHSSLPAFQGCRVLQYAVHIAFILAGLSGMPCSPVCGTHCIHPCRPFRDAVFSSMRYTLHSSLPAFQGCRVLQYAVHIAFILAGLSGMPCSPVCGTHCIHPCRPFRDAVFSSMRYTLHSSLPAFQGCRVLQYAVHIAFILAGLSGMPCSPVCGTHCIHPCRPFRDAVFSSMRYTLHSSLPAFQGCRVLQYAVHTAFILAGLSGMPCSPVCGTHCIHPCRPFRDAVFSSMRYTLHSSLPAFQGCRVLQYAVHTAFILAGLSGMPCSPVCGTHCIHPCRPFRDAVFSSMRYTLHSSLPAFQGCRVLQYAVHTAFILAGLSGMPCSPVCGTHCIHPCRPFRDAVFSSMRYTLHSSLPAFQGCRVLQYAVHTAFILAGLSGMPCSPVCGTHCIHPCRPFRDAVFSSMRYTLHSSLPAFQGCRVLQYAVHTAFILAGLSGMPCSPVCGTHCIHPCRPFRDAVFSSMRYTLHSSLPAFQGCRVLQYAVHTAFILAGLSGMPCSPVCGTHCIHPCRPFRDAVFSSMRYTLHSSLPAFQGCRVLQYAVHTAFILAGLSGMPCSPVCGTHCIHPCRPFRDAVFSSMRYTLHSSLPAFQGCRVLQYAVHTAFILAGLSGMPCSPVCGTHCIHPCRPFRDAVFSSMRYTLHSSLPAFQGCRVLQYAVHTAFILAGLSGMPCSPVCGTHCIHPCRPFRDAVFSSMRYTLHSSLPAFQGCRVLQYAVHTAFILAGLSGMPCSPVCGTHCIHPCRPFRDAVFSSMRYTLHSSLPAFQGCRVLQYAVHTAFILAGLSGMPCSPVCGTHCIHPCRPFRDAVFSSMQYTLHSSLPAFQGSRVLQYAVHTAFILAGLSGMPCSPVCSTHCIHPCRPFRDAVFSSMQYTLHSSLPAFQGCRVLQYAVHIAFILAGLSGMPCSPVCSTHCIHPCRPFRDAVFSSMQYTLHSSLPAFQGCRVLQYAVHIAFILAGLSGMPCSPVCSTHCIHPCRPFRDAVFSSMQYTLHSSLPAFQGCRVLQYAVHIAFILAGLSGMPCSPVCSTHCIHPCRPFRDAVFSSMQYTLHSSLPAFQGCRVLQYAVHIAFILAGLSGMPCSPVCSTHCIHPCRPFRDAVFSSMQYTLHSSLPAFQGCRVLQYAVHTAFILAGLSGMPCSPVCSTHCIHPCWTSRDAMFSSMQYIILLHSSLPAFQGCGVL